MMRDTLLSIIIVSGICTIGAVLFAVIMVCEWVGIIKKVRV
jgi:hypothetical protein